jgi:hypothetical protein
MEGGPETQAPEIPGFNAGSQANAIQQGVGSTQFGVPGQQMSLEQEFGPNAGLPTLIGQEQVPVQQGQPQMPGNLVDAMFAPSQSNSRTGAGSPNRGGGGVQMGDAGYAWQVQNSDYNPAGYKPNESRSAGVGKYGGGPLFAAALAAPNAVLASSIQAVKNERKQVQDAFSKFDPMAGIEDVNAPEYRDSFQRAVADDLDGYVDGVMELHGDSRGMKILANPTSKERRELRARGEAWNTVSRHINQATNNAQAIIEGMKKGTIQQNPTLLKQAEEVRYKLGEYEGQQDPKKLAKSLVTLNANVSLVDQMKADGIVDLIKSAGTTSKLYEQVKKGDPLYHNRFRTLVGTKQVNYDEIVNSLTDSYAQQYGDDLTKEQVRTMIKSVVPDNLIEEDIVQDELSLPKSGGGSGTKNKGSLTPEDIVVPKTAVDANGNPVNKSFDEKGNEVWRQHIALQKFSNGQGTIATPDAYTQGSTPIEFIPTGLVNVDNDVQIMGKRAGLPRSQVKRVIQERAGADDNVAKMLAILDPAAARYEKGEETPEDMQVLTEFLNLQDVVIPAKGNWRRLEGSFGISENDAMKQHGITDQPAPKQEQPKAAAKLPTITDTRSIGTKAQERGVKWDEKVYKSWPKEKQQQFIEKIYN